MKYIWVILLIPLVSFFLSCKKDKLKDDKELLIGEWNWVYSNHEYGWCGDTNGTAIYSPVSMDNNFTIKFYKKGNVEFYDDDGLVKKYRTVFSGFKKSIVCPGDNTYNFGIYLDNNTVNKLYGCVSPDTLLLGPFDDFFFTYSEGCESYLNYFTRK